MTEKRIAYSFNNYELDLVIIALNNMLQNPNWSEDRVPEIHHNFKQLRNILLNTRDLYEGEDDIQK